MPSSGSRRPAEHSVRVRICNWCHVATCRALRGLATMSDRQVPGETQLRTSPLRITSRVAVASALPGSSDMFQAA
jgi:hypothetical protein